MVSSMIGTMVTIGACPLALSSTAPPTASLYPDPHFGRVILRYEGANFLAKGRILSGQIELHTRLPPRNFNCNQ